MEEIRQELASLKLLISEMDKELHQVKHENNNIKNQINGIYNSLEKISDSFETFMQKYDGNSEIGYVGKFTELKADMEKLKESNKILMDAYEIGKVWKIKLSGFFMVALYLAGFVGLLFSCVKGLVWIFDHFSIIKK